MHSLPRNFKLQVRKTLGELLVNVNIINSLCRLQHRLLRAAGFDKQCFMKSHLKN